MTTLDLIAGERRRVADLLDGLDAAQWASPSLCDGWTVRDVAAHLTAGWSYPKLAFGRLMLRHRGFDGANAVAARELAKRPTEAIVADLRDNADNPFSPPIVGLVAQLADVITHGQDIARPLGLDHDVEPAVVRPALDLSVGRKASLVSPTKHRYGTRFMTDDQAWSWGSGAEVSGSSTSILLALLGRADAVDALEGPGVGPLRKRLH
ncbi:MAG: maleylpyruvate isomerase family mycothiol-dependent enzyme [Acidimicrobiales bacterium]|nr:maleylpyruvate isomerase family mycothiol-dependent enzyme [Acidimicrobiales bacterium]